MKTAKMEVTLLNHMGSDLTVVNAARVSFAKESEWERTCSCGITETRDGRWPGCGSDVRTCAQRVTNSLPDRDARLIRYLAKHNHWTPFGH